MLLHNVPAIDIFDDDRPYVFARKTMEPPLKRPVTIESAKEALESQVLKLRGVEGMGIGGGTRSLQIEVYVKVLTTDLQSLIPDEFHGFPVKIVKTGEFVARRSKGRR
jgi:hypothetical protein